MTKIMIVDDEPDLRDMLDILMKNEGYDTEMAVDGSDFLKKIDRFDPDIVTLDVMMPGPTTMEILEKLKKKKSKPKVILLTVVRFDRDEKKIFEQRNVVDYIKKPFDMDEFLQRVKKQLK